MIGRRPRRIASVVVVLWLAGCSSGSPSVLDPRGRQADRIAGLWWLLLWVSLSVLLVVLGLMVAAILRRRRPAVPEAEPRWGRPFVVLAGVLVPVVVMSIVFVVSLRDLNAMTAEEDGAALTIDVVGHMWWWEAAYPNGAVTANEIHVPAGEPVRLALTTDDVIHSLWVPQLGPKVDMIPGRTNHLTIEAAQPGRYRGQCAEFCGLQHAHMAFFVVAEPPDRFESWMSRMAAPASEPTGAAAVAGRDLFVSSSCGACHTIDGTGASGDLGPDLTHVGSRETIGAGTLPIEGLRRWIADPQSIKPGSSMPPSDLSEQELDDLVAYLRELT